MRCDLVCFQARLPAAGRMQLLSSKADTKESSVAWRLQVAMFGKRKIAPEQFLQLCTCSLLGQSPAPLVAAVRKALPSKEVVAGSRAVSKMSLCLHIASPKAPLRVLMCVGECFSRSYTEQLRAVQQEPCFHFNAHSSQGEEVEAFCNDLNKTLVSRACKHSVFL